MDPASRGRWHRQHRWHNKNSISNHPSYWPFGFCMDTSGTTQFTNTATIDELFSRLNYDFIAQGIPVVMGEWASTNKNNTSERVKHAAYYAKAASNVGIPTIVWDNNGYTALETMQWDFTIVVAGIGSTLLLQTLSSIIQ